MDSGGAVIALLTFEGLLLLPFALEDTGDNGGESVEEAMMTSLCILAYSMLMSTKSRPCKEAT